MRKKNLILMMVIFFIASQAVYSAPINLPSTIKGIKGEIFSYEHEPLQIEVSAGLEADFVTKRKLDELNAKIEGNLYTAKLLFSSAEKFDLYVNLGHARDIEYKANILGSSVKFDLEDEFVWGTGISYVFTSQDDPLQIGIDGNYRRITDMDYTGLCVDDATYSKSQLGGKVNAKWREWQVALIVGKKFDLFIPYVGVKYSDVKASAKAIVSGSTYDLGSTDSKHKVGVFAGCSIVPVEQLSIDIQGRFIDETAITAGVSYKF